MMTLDERRIEMDARLQDYLRGRISAEDFTAWKRDINRRWVEGREWMDEAQLLGSILGAPDGERAYLVDVDND